MNYSHVTHHNADLERDAKALAEILTRVNPKQWCTDLDAVEMLCDYFPDARTIIPFGAIDELVTATNKEIEAIREHKSEADK